MDPAEIVGNCDVFLRELSKYLTSEDLRVAQRVSRTWRSATRAEFLKKCPIVLDEYDVKLYMKESTGHENYKLGISLTPPVLKQSVNGTVVQQFFDKFGPGIKTLDIRIKPEVEQEVSQFQQFLPKLPKLEEIIIRVCYKPETDEDDDHRRVTFVKEKFPVVPSLKICTVTVDERLAISENNTFAEESGLIGPIIFHCFPNMEQVTVLEQTDVQESLIVQLVEKPEGLSKLSRINLSRCSTEELFKLARVKFHSPILSLSLQPECESGHEQHSVMQGLNKVLIAFAPSLQQLELNLRPCFGKQEDYDEDGYVEDDREMLRFPKMPQLHTLCVNVLEEWDDLMDHDLANGLVIEIENYEEFLPNLKILELSTVNGTQQAHDDLLDSFLGEEDPYNQYNDDNQRLCESVRELRVDLHSHGPEIFFSLPSNVLARLKATFPNLDSSIVKIGRRVVQFN